MIKNNLNKILNKKEFGLCHMFILLIYVVLANYLVFVDSDLIFGDFYFSVRNNAKEHFQLLFKTNFMHSYEALCSQSYVKSTLRKKFKMIKILFFIYFFLK